MNMFKVEELEKYFTNNIFTYIQNKLKTDVYYSYNNFGNCIVSVYHGFIGNSYTIRFKTKTELEINLPFYHEMRLK